MFFRKRNSKINEGQDDPTLLQDVETSAALEPSLATETIKLVEEELDIGKVTVLGDTVRISSMTETETVPIRDQLRRESYDVKRVARDEVVDAIPEVRKEGGVTIIPVLEERLVVRKELVLREEIHLVPQHTVSEYQEDVELRKQRAVIDRIAAE